MTNKMMFEVEDAEVIDDDPNSQFATARISAFSTGVSLHETTCDDESLKRTASTIYEKPVIFNYDPYVHDFKGHAGEPIISGFIVPNSANFIEREDGRTSLTVLAKIWKRYSGKFIDIFKTSNSDKRAVSVELEINKSEKTPDGLLRLVDWVYSAVCVLGEYVTPASPDAEIQMLSFSKKENLEYEMAYKREFSKRYDDIDFIIPEGIKKNCQSALDNHMENGSSASSVALSNARYIVKNEKMSPERMRHIHKILHRGNSLEDPNINFYGGEQAREWSSNVISQMDEMDDREMTYYETEEKESDPPIEDGEVYLEKKEETISMKKDEKEKEDEMKEEEMAEEEKAPEAEEKKEEMAAEEKPEEKPEEKEEEMAVSEQVYSLNENLDVAAMLAFLKNETKQYREMKEMESVNFAINAIMGEISKGKEASLKAVTDGMSSYMQAASKIMFEAVKQNKTFSDENTALKNFKTKVESERKDYEVDKVLKEAFEAGMPQVEIDACKEDAINFSLAEIDSYKNKVKAKAFQYFGQRKEEKDDGIVRFDYPFTEKKFAEPTLWK